VILHCVVTQERSVLKLSEGGGGGDGGCGNGGIRYVSNGVIGNLGTSISGLSIMCCQPTAAARHLF
jgi:hypothetical protein